MNKCILIFSLFIASLSLHSQQLDWVTSYGTSSSEFGSQIVSDKNGNSYIIGSSTTGDVDFFVLKLDSSGVILWNYQIGNTVGNDNAVSIDVDTLGNVYITGNFSLSTDFDSGPTDQFLNSNGGRDGFLLKLNTSGQFLWAKSIGGIYHDNISTLSIDQNGFLYIGGNFEGTVDFNPGSTPVIISSNNLSSDFFVQKRDSDGNLVWTKCLGSIVDDDCRTINCDNVGNIYITGRFLATCDFDPGIDDHSLTPTPINSDPGAFILKLDENGGFIWAKQVECIDEVYINASTLDKDGGLIITGTFKGTNQDFDPGPSEYLLSSYFNTKDCFILSLDSFGNFKWANSVGNDGLLDYGTSVQTDTNGNVLWAGSFLGIVDFDSSPSHFDLGVEAHLAGFIQLLDSNGNHVWATDFGEETSSNDFVSDVEIDINGGLLATGMFYSVCDFDPGSLSNYKTHLGGGDAFFLKLNDAPLLGLGCQDTSTVDSITCCGAYTWINGITYQSSSHFDDFVVLSSTQGCDSIVQLDLTINTIDAGITFLNPTAYANSYDANYQWVDCVNGYSNVPSATDQIFIPQSTGYFAVIITENGCSDTSNCFEVSSLAEVIEFKPISSVSIYPNPFNERTNIYFNHVTSEDLTISIFDVFGKQIYAGEISNDVTITFSRQGLAAGIYFLIISNNEGTLINEKLIVN